MQQPKSFVPAIPESAPFTETQRAWLNGYLAGLFSNADSDEQAGEESLTPVTILWGSQTGTAEALAKKVGKTLGASGFLPAVQDMGEYDPAKITEEKLLIVLTSTYGEGDPPDNAQALHSFILGGDAPKLERVNFAVLSLGDVNYEHFCKAGIDFDQRLGELGGNRVLARVDCDVEYDELFEKWEADLKAILVKDFKISEGATVAPEARSEEVEEVAYSKKNPYRASVSECLKLNGDGSAKDVRHIAINLGDSGLTYDAGDAIGIFPRNCEDLVSDLIKTLSLKPDEEVKVGDSTLSLEEALVQKLDVNSLTKSLLQKYNKIAKNEHLETLITTEDSTRLKEYLKTSHTIDLVAQFKAKFEAQEFVDILPKLQPRLYSISSSPKPNPAEVCITVGTVRYEMNGRKRKGVCSTFLAERLPKDRSVDVFFHPNKNFRLPEEASTPVIMIGPGTGIAPFRAFLQERESSGAEGKNWLFFGDQHSKTDFLYEELIAGWQKSGLLSKLDTAFSRDQVQKIYVQDKIKGAGREFFQWLEDGAHIYVCGDASRMAKDVDSAIHEVITEAGNLSQEAAQAYLKDLKKAKRYQRDVY